MKRIIFFILLLTLFFSCSLDETLNELLVQAIDYKGFSDDKWTIMIYMCSDNDLNPYSVYDINEMIEIEIPIWCNDENINIVVLWDQIPTIVGGNRHGYYLIKYSGAKLLYDTGEIDMGDAQVVKDFIDFTLDRYRADHYIFVFWDHGTGVDKSIISSDTYIQKSVGRDESDGSSELSDSEQVDILQHLNAKIGRKLDLLVYDACLMGMAEIMHQAKNYANYFVGSEDNVPGFGLVYDFISEIYNDPSISISKVAKKIVTTYASEYSSSSQITLSAINLSKMTELSSYITSFVLFTLTENTNKECFYYTTPDHIGDDIEFFPSSINPTGYPFGYTDLYYYMKNVKQKLIDAGNPTHPAITHADNIINFIDNGGIIIKEYHGPFLIEKAKGISILLSNIDTEYPNNAFNNDTNWAGFIDWLDIP
ncbi:MAG: hypothetical protein JXB50_00335 [Spirochaetes bacterium]|nr:hypothetical protein [Spirochaetota bacterium]